MVPSTGAGWLLVFIYIAFCPRHPDIVRYMYMYILILQEFRILIHTIIYMYTYTSIYYIYAYYGCQPNRKTIGIQCVTHSAMTIMYGCLGRSCKTFRNSCVCSFVLSAAKHLYIYISNERQTKLNNSLLLRL